MSKQRLFGSMNVGGRGGEFRSTVPLISSGRVRVTDGDLIKWVHFFQKSKVHIESPLLFVSVVVARGTANVYSTCTS